MLVQVDGWSGSGKSVLMYLLDGHPEIYSHPFHDIIQFLFRKEEWEEEWVKKKDIWELRTRLAKLTQYYKSESFIRQGRYVVEFKSNVQLEYKFRYNFSRIDEGIINKLQALEKWTPEAMVEVFMGNFRSVLMPHCTGAKHFAFMGGWRGLDNSNAFPQLYPNGKRIVIKRDVKDIIAVKSGRKPTDLDFRSKSHNNVSASQLTDNNEVRKCIEYYKEYERLSIENRDSVMVVTFDDLILKKEATLRSICQFLNIDFHIVLLHSSVMGKPVVYEGIDYAGQVLDKYFEILTDEEIVLIDKAIQDKYRLRDRLSPTKIVSWLLWKNIKYSNSLMSRVK